VKSRAESRAGDFPRGIAATARSETVRNGGRDHSPPASDRTRCFARLQNEKPKTRRASEIPRDYVAKTVYIITELPRARGTENGPQRSGSCACLLMRYARNRSHLRKRVSSVWLPETII